MSPPSDSRAATVAFSAAGALTAVAVLPFPYALRAGVAVLVGVVLMGLGLQSGGPLGGLTVDGSLERGVARLVTLTALPAALMFRARYTAFRRARVILAVALALALPFVVLEAILVADGSAPGDRPGRRGAERRPGRACSLFGFMGQGTTGWAALWAALVLGGLPIPVGLRHFTLADDCHRLPHLPGHRRGPGLRRNRGQSGPLSALGGGLRARGSAPVAGAARPTKASGSA